MADNTLARKKLVSFMKKKDPTLSEKDTQLLLNDFGRFVNLARKIYTEPQAHVSYRDKVVGKKIVKDRIFTTNMGEISKIMDDKTGSFLEVIRKFYKSVTNSRDED